MNVFKRIFFLVSFLAAGYASFSQTAGQVMFVGFNADGNDGFSFVTLVDLPNGTILRFNDNEWGGAAFDADTDGGTPDGSITWTNSTGAAISSGTVISINNSATTPVATIGTTSGGTINLRAQDEVLYMFIGTNASTPTTFLSAISNNNFSVANGSLTSTGLTSGTNAIPITGNEDVMIYTGNINRTTSIPNTINAIANTANWTTQDTAGDDSANGFPDFPASNPCNFYGVAFGQTIYYSRTATSGGAWDSNTAWTTNSDGSGGPLAAGVWPKRHDNVVILAGHTIVVNAVDDNKSCGVSPEDLALSNVGPGFSSSSVDMFYHIGDITISGILSVTGGATDAMVAGYTRVLAGGAFNLASNLTNLGYLQVDASSTLSIQDDFQLTGSSTTVINTASIITDNLGIDHRDATLCGTGTATLQSGGGSAIVYTNSATVSQICSSFVVSCTGGGCSGFPVSGTGSTAGNSGPGGVGKTNGTSSLVLWLNSSAGIATSGTAVTAWNDQSGFGNHAIPPTATNRPTLVTGALNAQSTLRFDGTNSFLSIPDHNSIDLTQWSFFLVSKANVHKNYNAFFVKGNDGSENYEFLSNFPVDGDLHFPVLWSPSTRTADAETSGTGSMSNTTYGVFQYDYDAVNLRVYKNLSQIFTRAESRTPVTNGLALLVGNEAGITGRNLNGDISELFGFNSKVNTAQQIIINNYLAAKYGLTLTANDIYTMDNNGNGDFDFNVAGIGCASDGTIHRDAKGPGIVRIVSQNHISFTAGEFLIWGHNNGGLTSNYVDIDNVQIRERLNRVWRISEVGDVGSISISFDINGLGSPAASDLRLLIDRDGDGFADNDVAPISGATFSSGIVTFSGVILNNGDRFTLATASLDAPLPVELDKFGVTALGHQALVEWSTASELKNDFFTVERSLKGDVWEVVGIVQGAGTTSDRTNYNIVDDGAYSGLSFYRIKQTDFDETYSYSPIRSVVIGDYPITVHPNPSTGDFTVTIPFVTENVVIKLFDNQGRILPITISETISNKIVVNTDQVPAGFYVLQVSDGISVKSMKVLKR